MPAPGKTMFIGGIGVGLGVIVAVGVKVGIDVFVAVGVSVAVGVNVFVGVAVGDGVNVNVGGMDVAVFLSSLSGGQGDASPHCACT